MKKALLSLGIIAGALCVCVGCKTTPSSEVKDDLYETEVVENEAKVEDEVKDEADKEVSEVKEDEVVEEPLLIADAEEKEPETVVTETVNNGEVTYTKITKK